MLEYFVFIFWLEIFSNYFYTYYERNNKILKKEPNIDCYLFGKFFIYYTNLQKNNSVSSINQKIFKILDWI
jgi:hypothetical protein